MHKRRPRQRSENPIRKPIQIELSENRGEFESFLDPRFLNQGDAQLSPRMRVGYGLDPSMDEPKYPPSPKRKKYEKNFIRKNMAKVIFEGRSPSLPPPQSPDEIQKILPDDKSSIVSAHLHKNFGKVPS